MTCIISTSISHSLMATRLNKTIDHLRHSICLLPHFISKSHLAATNLALVLQAGAAKIYRPSSTPITSSKVRITRALLLLAIIVNHKPAMHLIKTRRSVPRHNRSLRWPSIHRIMTSSSGNRLRYDLATCRQTVALAKIHTQLVNIDSSSSHIATPTT